MSYLGDKVFISYRGRDYPMAVSLARDLQNGGHCGVAVLVPPERLSGSNEIPVRATVHGAYRLHCPGCSGPIRLSEGPQRGTFYRKPVLIEGDLTKVIPPDSATLDALLVLNELPDGISLVKFPDEQLDSDATKVLKVYGLSALVAGAAAVVGSLIRKRDTSE